MYMREYVLLVRNRSQKAREDHKECTYCLLHYDIRFVSQLLVKHENFSRQAISKLRILNELNIRHFHNASRELFKLREARVADFGEDARLVQTEFQNVRTECSLLRSGIGVSAARLSRNVAMPRRASRIGGRGGRSVRSVHEGGC